MLFGIACAGNGAAAVLQRVPGGEGLLNLPPLMSPRGSFKVGCGVAEMAGGLGGL